MRKRLLFLLLAINAIVLLQGQVRLQLLSPQEQLEVAQTLGKTVFCESKLVVYDPQDNLILEMPLSVGLKMIVDAENNNVTISSPEVEEVEFDIDTRIYTSIEDMLVFNGIPANSVIRVYTLNGKLVKQGIAEEATITIPIQDLPSGTYIMQVNNTILKVLK